MTDKYIHLHHRHHHQLDRHHRGHHRRRCRTHQHHNHSAELTKTIYVVAMWVCSARFGLTVLGFFGFMCFYMQRNSMSVAIVCMVNHTAISTQHGSHSNGSDARSVAEADDESLNVTRWDAGKSDCLLEQDLDDRQVRRWTGETLTGETLTDETLQQCRPITCSSKCHLQKLCIKVIRFYVYFVYRRLNPFWGISEEIKPVLGNLLWRTITIPHQHHGMSWKCICLSSLLLSGYRWG